MRREQTHYRYTPESDKIRPTHLWAVVTPLLAMHLRICDRGAENAEHPELIPELSGRYIGGIEQHWPSPPSWALREGDADRPSNNDCWLFGGPCWHDGSSLQVEKYWIPLWLQAPHDHDAIFAAIQQEIEERLEYEARH